MVCDLIICQQSVEVVDKSVKNFWVFFFLFLFVFHTAINMVVKKIAMSVFPLKIFADLLVKQYFLDIIASDVLQHNYTTGCTHLN